MKVGHWSHHKKLITQWVKFKDVFNRVAGPGVDKPIGEALLQIDMLLGKERKVNVKGETHAYRCV